MKNKSNFISVEASAGSGKTHNLAKRYISLLLDFDLSKTKPPLNNILALTFANKATVEMKERIIENLKKISLGLDVNNLTDDINLPKKEIEQNALTAINTLIFNYDNFNVRTIDSFINLIIKACALKLGFSPNYKILDSYNEYIDYSVDSFLDKIVADKKVEQILNVFFDQFLVDDGKDWSIKKYISRRFNDFYVREISKDSIVMDMYADYSNYLLSLSKKFSEICNSMTKIKEYDGLNQNLKNAIEKVKDNSRSFFNISSTYFQKDKLSYKKNCPESIQLNILFEKQKKILKDYAEFKSKHFYDNYIEMFNYIFDEFDKRAIKDSVLFLQDINRKVLNIFEQETLVPEIYCSLSANIRDFLIDEFQDTNKIQWETLKLIVEENLSQNGSFFYVGDKKQAIYGFRGGDSQIFDVPLEEFKIYNPQQVHLDMNYRSCQAIVDFNNSIFSSENVKNLLDYISETKKINNSDKYSKQIAEVFKNSFQKTFDSKKNLGYVEVSSVVCDKEDDADEKVRQYLFQTIEELRKRFEYKDITILCRWGKEVEKISKWLLEKNINIESFKTLNIINSNIVKELFSALQFFNSPINNISFASFITSSFFLKQTKLDKREILDFIYTQSRSNNKVLLYVEFRNNYPTIWEEYIDKFFASVGFIAVYEFMVSIISKFNVMENFKQESNLVLAFLEVISDFEKKEQGLQNFIDYFKDYENNKSNEKFFVKVPSGNAIKIMTIHKAKGLQFNVVIMPYFNIDSPIPKNPFYVEDGDGGSFMYMRKDFVPYSDKLKDIYNKSYFKLLSDELNILYVATTRAVYEFYALILKSEKETDKKSFVDVFVKENVRIVGKKQIYRLCSENKEDNEIIELSPGKMDDIVDVISDSATEIYGRKNKDMLLRGQIIHYALSLIETFDNLSLKNIIKFAMEQVSVAYPNEDIGWLEQMITELLSDSRIAAFFDKSKDVFNEKEFVDSFGNTIRIDKLVVKRDSVDIVDFKNSLYDKQYIQKQLDNYKNVVESFYDNKKINKYVVDIEKKEVIKF